MAPSTLGTAALLLAAATTTTTGAAAATSTTTAAACGRAAGLLATQCVPGLGPWAGPARCCAPLAALKALGCACDGSSRAAVDRALAAPGVAPGVEAACGVDASAESLAAACGTPPSPALASRADAGPWDALLAATRDLGARLGASAAAWRDVMAGRGAGDQAALEGGAGGSEAETVALGADGSLAASLDIAYGAGHEAPGAVLSEIADWVASLGEVGGAGAGAGADPDRAAAAADVADLLDGLAARMDAALVAAGASPDTEVEYDVAIALGTADGATPSTVDMDVRSADPAVTSGMLAAALAAAAGGAAADAAASGVAMSAVVEEWACPPGALAGWLCERADTLSSLASAGAFAAGVAAVAALLGVFDDDEEDEFDDDAAAAADDDDADAEAARAEYASLAGGDLTDARPPLWAVTAKH